MYYKDFKGKDFNNLYDIGDLQEALGAKDSEAFMNASSGGGSNTSIWQWKNITTKDAEEIIDEEEELTLEDAAERWRDEILTENGWDNGIDTYYETPLKVVEVKV